MKTFPPEVISAAITSYKKYGVSAAVTLAQWALESDFGTKVPMGSNNPFGIKATGDQPGVTTATYEYKNGYKYSVSAKFRKFDSIEDAFNHHAALIATGKPYTKLHSKLNDYISLSKGLTGIYATDPHYGEKLINIVDNYRLAQYDNKPKAVVSTAKPVLPTATAIITVASVAAATVAKVAPNTIHSAYTIDWAAVTYFSGGGLLTCVCLLLIGSFLLHKENIEMIRPDMQATIDAIVAMKAKADTADALQVQVTQLQEQLSNAVDTQVVIDDNDTFAAIKSAAGVQ